MTVYLDRPIVDLHLLFCDWQILSSTCLCQTCESFCLSLKHKNEKNNKNENNNAICVFLLSLYQTKQSTHVKHEHDLRG